MVTDFVQNFNMTKINVSKSIIKIDQVAGKYNRSEESPSLFINPDTGISVIVKDKPSGKAALCPSVHLLVKGSDENAFYHLSGMWRVTPSANEYRISDNIKTSPKGIGYVKYDLFHLVITTGK